MINLPSRNYLEHVMCVTWGSLDTRAVDWTCIAERKDSVEEEDIACRAGDRGTRFFLMDKYEVVMWSSLWRYGPQQKRSFVRWAPLC